MPVETAKTGYPRENTVDSPDISPPALAPLETTKSGLPAFGLLIFPCGDRQTDQTGGRPGRGARLPILPHNAEAEQGLLGASMVDNSALEKVRDFPQPYDFYIPVHQRLYKAMYDVLRQAAETAQRAFNHNGDVTGVTTGFRSLDRRLGGLQPSDLIILAGRPSMGKIPLAANICVNAARCYAETGGKEGAAVGFSSLEMSGEQLGQRVLAEQTGISSDA